MTTTETLPDRPHIAMPMFDAAQLAQLERVKANIAPLMQGLGRAKPGDWLLTLLPSLRLRRSHTRRSRCRLRSLSRSLGCGRTLQNRLKTH